MSRIDLPLPVRLQSLAGAVLFILTILIAWGTGTRAEPFVPADDAMVIERLPLAIDAAARELRALRDQLAARPADLALAVRLARRYVELGRAEADPRYFGYAQAALLPWWDQESPPADVLVLRATLRQNRHDFEAALTDLQKALAAQPRHAQAWLTQAVILQVQGRYEEAKASCARLAILASRLIATACLADATALSGNAERAEQLLQAALNDDAAGPAVRLWALTILAEIAARQGKAALAERHFRTALSLNRRDAYLLGAYADFLLEHDRAADARELLAEETRADPLLLRLALAEQSLGAPELATHVESLAARFAASRLRGDTLHRREEARFRLQLANQPAEALRLALENWQVQREPWDARLVLETALAAKQPSAAADVIAWLDETRLQDGAITALRRRLTGDQP